MCKKDGIDLSQTDSVFMAGSLVCNRAAEICRVNMSRTCDTSGLLRLTLNYILATSFLLIFPQSPNTLVRSGYEQVGVVLVNEMERRTLIFLTLSLTRLFFFSPFLFSNFDSLDYAGITIFREGIERLGVKHFEIICLTVMSYCVGLRIAGCFLFARRLGFVRV